MSTAIVNLYFAIGEEWGDPLNPSEIFAAECPEQATQEMARYINDPAAKAVQLSDADLQVLHEYEGDGRLVPRSEALKLYLDRGDKVPCYFETSEIQ